MDTTKRSFALVAALGALVAVPCAVQAAEEVIITLTNPPDQGSDPWTVTVGDVAGTNQVTLEGSVQGSNRNVTHVDYLRDEEGKFTVQWEVVDTNDGDAIVASGSTTAAKLTDHKFIFQASTAVAKTYILVAKATFREKTKSGHNTYTRQSKLTGLVVADGSAMVPSGASSQQRDAGPAGGGDPTGPLLGALGCLVLVVCLFIRPRGKGDGI